MRYIAAYLLLQIGGNASPSEADIKTVLEAAGCVHASLQDARAEEGAYRQRRHGRCGQTWRCALNLSAYQFRNALLLSASRTLLCQGSSPITKD